jgi:NAD(P)-dependent dehydrogenase (short-subunit alcohol dehydrogenase family)
MAAIADVSGQSIAELISLSGRNAVVTGAAQGLGRAIASRLAEAGASVLIGDVLEGHAHASAKDIAELWGRKVMATTLDVTRAESVAAAADLAVNKLGGIDLWVNNAGIFPRNSLVDIEDADWDRVLDVNLRGVFLGCREAARRMVAAGRGGVLINIASTAGFRGVRAGLSHYVASKHGVRGLTRQLALELAPDRIRVLAVAPTLIVTEGVRASQQISTDKGDEIHVVNCPLGRSGVPDDIARVVLFCASDLSLYMTGSTLIVDAGELL